MILPSQSGGFFRFKVVDIRKFNQKMILVNNIEVDK